MIKFKEGGIVHQLYTMFGIQSAIYGAKSVCQIFWGIILNLILCGVVGGIIAFAAGHLIAGTIVSLMTLKLTLPVAVFLFVAAIVLGFAGLMWLIFTTIESEKAEELGTLVRGAYAAHKQKFCPNVEFTS